MTIRPTAPVMTRAKRGDLAVLAVCRVERTDGRRRPKKSYRIVRVTNVDSSGAITAVRDDSHYPEPTRLDNEPDVAKTYVIPRSRITSSPDAVMALVRAHVTSGSTNPRDYDTLNDVRAALAGHITY